MKVCAVSEPYIDIYHSDQLSQCSVLLNIPLDQDNNLGVFNSHVQGVDPDAPEEDEDNEADDIDADQDDAELLQRNIVSSRRSPRQLLVPKSNVWLHNPLISQQAWQPDPRLCKLDQEELQTCCALPFQPTFVVRKKMHGDCTMKAVSYQGPGCTHQNCCPLQVLFG